MTANQISHAAQVADQQHMERMDAENKRHNERDESINTVYNNELQRHNAAMESINRRTQEIDQEKNRLNAALQFADIAARISIQNRTNNLKQEEITLEKVRMQYDYDLEKARQNLIDHQNQETQRHNKAMENLSLFQARTDVALRARQIEYQNTYWRDSIVNQRMDIFNRKMQNERLFRLEKERFHLQQQEFKFNSAFTTARTQNLNTQTQFIPWNAFYGAIGQASSLFRIGGL